MTCQENPAAEDHGNGGTPPSLWVVRFAPAIPKGGQVLDLACGGGRHARLLLAAGHSLLAIDRDTSKIKDLEEQCEIVTADLEAPGSDPLAGRHFTGIVVTNYLHRPLLARLPAALEPGGILIYETFALGNERFGKPSNPDFLLKPGELLDAVEGPLRVRAYEDLIVERPKPAAVQRLVAEKMA